MPKCDGSADGYDYTLLLLPDADVDTADCAIHADTICVLGRFRLDPRAANACVHSARKLICFVVTPFLDAGRQQALIDLLREDGVWGDRSGITVMLVPSALEARDVAVSLASRIRYDVPEYRHVYVRDEPLAEGQLDFMRIYYDVGAVSMRMEPGEHGLIPEDLRETVAKEGYVPEKFWYWDEESATYWQKLSRPRSRYELVQVTTQLVEANSREIASKLWEVMGDLGAWDFVDLGVGTPRKDIALLGAICDQCRDDAELGYYPVDISFPLLEYTLRQVLPLQVRYRADKGLRLLIRPVIGDFEFLQRPDYRDVLSGPRPRLFALLGNTLGNLVEERMLHALTSIMTEQDLLLLDAEFLGDRAPGEMVTQYKTEAMYNFVFHPLELLSDSLGIKKEFTKMRVDAVKDEPVRFHFWPRGTEGRRKSRPQPSEVRLTSVPGSIVIVMKHAEDHKRSLLMAWSTKYERAGLERFLSRWFETLWAVEQGHYGLFLLGKRGRR